MRKSVLVLAALVVILAVVGGVYWFMHRGGPGTPSDIGQAALPPVTPQDPGSIFCGTLKGTVTFKNGSGGSQIGICNLPDGRKCEKDAFAKDNTCNPA